MASKSQSKRQCIEIPEGSNDDMNIDPVENIGRCGLCGSTGPKQHMRGMKNNVKAALIITFNQVPED
jgi:hypothetical protein